MFSDRERQVARLLQGDIQLVSQPFQEIGAATGHTEQEILTMISSFLQRGEARKFGAVIRHQLVGYTHNAMIAWAAPSERIVAVGKILAARKEVTHCYERTPPFLGRYNLFSMVHGQGKDLDTRIVQLAAETGIEDYLVLKSEEELKKSSMEYFT